MMSMRGLLVGDSPALCALRAEIHKFAAFPRPVLIRGERGTGKELVAQALHAASARAIGPFLTVNCAGFVGGLSASEFFGHEKGAFTGAAARRIGLFEEADGGSLFLDEIGNMPLELQRLLLRAIEYRTFRRIGGTRDLEADVRIIAASNVALEERPDFLPDLLDRLRYVEIRVPPLKERLDDIPLLAEHFLEAIRKEAPMIRAEGLDASALAALRARPWPGNVRELKAAVERAAFGGNGPLIKASDLEPTSAAASSSPASLAVAKTVRQETAALERARIEEALRLHKTLRAAAPALGLSYDALRRLIRKHGLRVR
jgi:DNA-binding NtrC family response regulator